MNTSKELSETVLLPTKPESILTLALMVIGRHQNEGALSPLKNQPLADLHYKTMLAKSKHDEGMKYLKLMEEAFAERDAIIGSCPTNGPYGNSIVSLLTGLALVLAEHGVDHLSKWGFELRDNNV
jgi:hypothetical protein